MKRSAQRTGAQSLLGFACSLAVSLVALASPVASANAAVITDRPLIFDFDGADTTAGPLVKPNKVAIDNSSGAVYVAEGEGGNVNWSVKNAISKFNPDGTAASFSATGTSSLFGPSSASFDTRVGIAVDNSSGPNQGRLYVADRDNSRLIAFAPEGDFLWEADLGKQVLDVAVDTAGHPWVLLQGVGDAGLVKEYTDTGSPAQNGSFEVLGDKGLDVDANGNVYVASETGVRKYVGGAFDSILDPAVSSDVYVDQSSPSGHIFAMHGIRQGTDDFNEYDASGNLVGSFATNGAIAAAAGIAYNPTLNRVYAANDGLGIVEALGPPATGTVPDPTIEASVVSGPGTATFHGTVNPQGVASAYYFEWTDATFTSFFGRVFRSPLQSLPEDSSPHAVQYKATNVRGNINWRVRLVTVNTVGGLRAVSGTDEFKPPKALANPIVTIGTPSVAPTTAHITGTINPREDSVEWRVERTTDPGCSTDWSTDLVQYLPGGELNAPQAVEYDLKGLSPAQHYCVRIRANNSFDPFGVGGLSEIKQFDTPALPPSEVSTAFAAPRTDTSARLNGRVNPEGSADFKYQFEWSEDGSTWTQLPIREASTDSTEPVVVSDELTGLEPNTTYHYRLAFAENETPPATLAGQEKTFTTRTTAEMALPKRGIEMVNNPDTGNQNVFMQLERTLPYISSDGDRVLWSVSGGAPGSASGVFATFLAERTPEGWRSRNAIPSAAEQLGEGRLRYQLDAASPDFTHFDARVREGGLRVTRETLVRLDDRQDQEVLHTFDWSGSGSENHLGGVDMTNDGAHVLTVDPKTKQLVDVGDGSPEVVSLMPDGTPSECGLNAVRNNDEGLTTSFLEYSSEGDEQWRVGYHRMASTDASLVYFKAKPNGKCGAPQGLYVRDRKAGETTLIDPGAKTVGDVEFIRASPNGRIGYFVTASQLEGADTNLDLDLYRWDQDTKESTCMTCVVADADIMPLVQIANLSAPILLSDDFSHAYFLSKRRLVPGEGIAGQKNVYVLSGGTIRFVATVNAVGTFDLSKGFAELSADGDTLVFLSLPGSRRLTSDAVACAGCQQLYRYDDREGGVECLSCVSGGTTPGGLSGEGRAGAFGMSADGSTIAFATAAGLVPRDVNRSVDVYEWRGGSVRLLTDGLSETLGNNVLETPGVWGVDRDGSNILFTAVQPGLTGFEQDRLRNLYDARIGGGFEPPSPPVHCSGDSCQGPLVAAPSGGRTASSAFSGRGNEKGTVKQRKGPCAKKRGKAKQRCVRKHKRHAQKNRAHNDAGRTK